MSRSSLDRQCLGRFEEAVTLLPLARRRGCSEVLDGGSVKVVRQLSRAKIRTRRGDNVYSVSRNREKNLRL